MFCSFPKTENLHHTWFLFGCLCFWNCNWRDGLFSEIGVLLTFIVQAAANGELGLSVPMSLCWEGEEELFFFSFLFVVVVGVLYIKLRLKAIVCWGIDR
jgi:hypothetical protein